MSCVIFNTPGLIDLRAFTVMGISAKPNSVNPIGYFGTGLKISLATLVRMGAEPIVWIGLDKYTFQKKPINFRGQDFEALRMKINKFRLLRSSYTELPYTTSYGRNWEPWMAFREMESNTRDENGETVYYADVKGQDIQGIEGRTCIVIEHEAFTQAYHDRDSIFLPEAEREGSGVQVIERPSDHLYWRGLKVYKLMKPSLFTYNFLDHLDLTEDRTLSNPYWARAVLARWLTSCDNEHGIASALGAAEKFWEHGIDFELPTSATPSAAFHSVMRGYKSKGLGSGAWRYYGRYDDRVTPKNFLLFEKHPMPWKVDGNAMRDRNGGTVFDAPFGYEDKWELTAEAILRLLIPSTPKEEEADEEPVGNDDED